MDGGTEEFVSEGIGRRGSGAPKKQMNEEPTKSRYSSFWAPEPPSPNLTITP